MTIISRNIAIAALLAGAVSAGAQDLQTEVEIRYQENPQLREINKLPYNPVLSLPVEKQASLPYSTAGTRFEIPAAITTLNPAAYADTIYTSPYRGYAAVGFMPKFNLGVSAGYKILDNDHTRLNAWLQYDGNVYSGHPLHTPWNVPLDGTCPESRYYRNHTGSIGINLHQAVGRESFIDAGVDYTFARFNTYTSHPGLHTINGSNAADAATKNKFYQNINRFNASVLWSLTHNDFHYGLGAAFSSFAPTSTLGFNCYHHPSSNVGLSQINDAKPTRETHFDVNGFFFGKFAGASSAGISFKVSHLYYNRESQFNGYLTSNLAHMGSMSHTLLSLKPYYRFDIDQFRLDIGINFDFTFSAGRVFHISPNAQATWLPSDLVKLYIKAGGGQWQNTLGSLYDVTPYALPFQAFHNSDIPIEAEVGATVGSWKGLFAEISFSYALANDWLMPVTTADYTMFRPVDMRGYKLHTAIGYSFRNIASIKASYEMAPQKYDRGYYLWRDRAKSVVNVDLTVTPFSPLDITVGWEYRGKRAMVNDLYYSANGFSDRMATYSLGSVNNLKAGALYRITPQWSAFIRGENLLNRECWLIGGIPAQGITGLVGAAYKF